MILLRGCVGKNCKFILETRDVIGRSIEQKNCKIHLRAFAVSIFSFGNTPDLE